MQRWMWAGLLAIVLALSLPGSGQAQEQRQLRWDRYDVAIDLQPDGRFRVCETQVITFVEGTFRTGFAEIPRDRVEAISAIQVSEPGQVYQANASQQPNTFTSRVSTKSVRIDWYFPPTTRASRTFDLCYLVTGGLRVHDWGDQLWWKAVAGDRPYTVLSSTITVTLPTAVPAGDLIPRTFAPSVTAEIVDGRTVRYQAGRVAANQEVEIGLQFPHGLVSATEPAWQAATEAAEANAARLASYRDLANLVFGAIALLIMTGGGVGLYILWSQRGRELPIGRVAEIIRQPPDDASPAVVGTLLDERADIKDIVATIPWLASRGVLRIQEVRDEGLFGIGAHADTRVTRLTSPTPLSDDERLVLTGLALDASGEVRLRQLNGRFSSFLPSIRRSLNEEVVHRGYFPVSPSTVRWRYRLAGIGLILAAGGIGALIVPTLAEFAGGSILPAIALGLVGIALVVLAQAMPRRTRAGALAAAKWRAFGRYLASIEQYHDLAKAGELFERYLPYAIVFGLERTWVRAFAAVDTPAPIWYLPSGVTRPLPWPGQPHPTGPIGRLPGTVTDAAGAGGGLQTMSDQVLGSLSSVSDSLLAMVDSASQTLQAPPPSERSGGGSGTSFGGGGRIGGGGGGGGGSRGFG